MQYRGMKDVLDFFTSRKRLFKFFDDRHLLDWMDDERYLKLAFRARMGYPLNLDNPRTFSEKLQWLKLYDRKPLYTQLVDKYAVRQYIAEKIGPEYLIPQVGGPWKRAEEIDFEALPEQFVLKCNHDSGGVVVCRDKSRLDLEETREKLNRHLQENYYMSGREWPYKDVEPCIFAEKYIEDERGGLRDYKFFCFDGEPKIMFVASERANPEEETKFDFYDMDFRHLNLVNGHPNATNSLSSLPCLEEMKGLAAKLSEGFPHIRVDLYFADGRIYFGEMTFYHWSGMTPFDPPEWDEKIGSWLELPEKE